MMRTIRLYGALGRRFGREFRIDVVSTAEAVRALALQIPGLREAIAKGRYRINCGARKHKGLLLDEGMLGFHLPAGDIHVVPVVQGGKSGGIGKIIIGTLLIASAFFVPNPFAGALFSLGASMALSGVSNLLSAKKKTEKQKRSYMDEGEQNAGQGGCVPLVIGRFLTTPLVISAGVTVNDSNGLV